MADWLLKTEPEDFSFADLKKAGTAVWDGVANPVAVKHIASMKKGDRIVVYHTGKEKAAVGVATVLGEPHPDPKEPKLFIVEIRAGAALNEPVTLEAIKASPLFSGSPLVKMGRLSVVPLTPPQYAFLTK